MKFLPLFFLGTSLLVSSASAALEVTTELMNATERKEAALGEERKSVAAAPAAAGAAPKAINQEKALKVTVRNASSKPEGNLLVRYWVVSRDMKTMKPALLDGGESNADLKPNGVAVINSDPVKASYTQRQIYTAVKAAGGAGAAKPAAPAKPVEAGGTKIVGHGAQVIKDGKVVGEFFTEAAYKALVGSEGTKPGPLFKAQKAEEAAQ